MVRSRFTVTSASPVKSILLPQSPEWLGLQARANTPRLIFVFLVETGFRHVGQAALEFLASSDALSSASRSAGIIGVSHRAQPRIFNL